MISWPLAILLALSFVWADFYDLHAHCDAVDERESESNWSILSLRIQTSPAPTTMRNITHSFLVPFFVPSPWQIIGLSGLSPVSTMTPARVLRPIYSTDDYISLLSTYDQSTFLTNESGYFLLHRESMILDVWYVESPQSLDSWKPTT